MMKAVDSPALAATCAALLLTIACGCSQGDAIAGKAPQAVANSAPVTSKIEQESMQAFAQRIGATCDEGDLQSCITGKIEVGDYLDVELRPGCRSQGKFAVVSAKRTELRDRAAPLDRRTVAMLERGQPLCIEAIGRAGEMAAYYYVRSQSEIPATVCGIDKECFVARAKQIHWVHPRSDDCDPSGPAPGQRHCAAGWIDADDVRLVGATE